MKHVFDIEAWPTGLSSALDAPDAARGGRPVADSRALSAVEHLKEVS
ncbi:hypothetical protein GCM10009830_29090 [Glycomyces endophyticus]|uniref:Uncharacterized protein n=1 Tax=Glycomyces endophyticus TaxID=480996 RepID=A0ABN2H1L7_9ACTN